MDGIVDPLVSNNDHQPIILNSDYPCIEFSKPEDLMTPLDDKDDKSSDTNSSSLSSIMADENGTGKQSRIKKIYLLHNLILILII